MDQDDSRTQSVLISLTSSEIHNISQQNEDKRGITGVESKPKAGNIRKSLQFAKQSRISIGQKYPLRTNPSLKWSASRGSIKDTQNESRRLEGSDSNPKQFLASNESHSYSSDI